MATEGSEQKKMRRALLGAFVLGLFIGMTIFLMVHYLYTYEYVCLKGEDFLMLLEKSGYI